MYNKFIKVEGNVMKNVSDKKIEKTIKNASMSTQMEGFIVTKKDKELCKKLLSKEINWRDYLNTVVSQRM